MNLRLYTIRRVPRLILEDGRVCTLTQTTDENGEVTGRAWILSPVYTYAENGDVVRLDGLPAVPADVACVDASGNLVYLDADGNSHTFDGRYYKAMTNVPQFSVDGVETYAAEEERRYLAQKANEANAQVAEAERKAEAAKAEEARARKLANEAAADALQLEALTSKLMKDGLSPTDAREQAQVIINDINRRAKEAASKHVITRKVSA